MAETTMIKKRAQMHRGPLPECHEGVGTLDWTNVLDGKDLGQKHLNFFHDDVLAPGVSIGVHRHEKDEEYYYILSGRGRMTLNGERFLVEAGDITAVYPGGEHGLENDGEEDLRIIVVSAS